MEQHVLEALTFLLAASQRIWKRRPDQKSKAGLDVVMQAHPSPLHMRLVERQELPDMTAREIASYLRKAQHLSHHQQHDKPAVCIDCYVALLLLLNPGDQIAH